MVVDTQSKLPSPKISWINSCSGFQLSARKAETATCLFLIALAILEIFFYQRVESFGSDSSTYIGIAHSITKHWSYQFDFKPETTYPPGFPLTLAAISVLVGESYSIFVRFMPIFGVLGLISAYRLLCRQYSFVIAAPAVLLLASSPYFFGVTTQSVLSDLPYFFASMLTLLMAAKLDTAEQPGPMLRGGFILFLCYSVMLRSAGLALLAGLAALLLRSLWAGPTGKLRLRRFGPALIIGAVLQGAWMRWAQKMQVRDWPTQANLYAQRLVLKDPHHPEAGVATLATVVARMGANVVHQGAHFSELFFHITWVRQVWYSPLVILPLLLTVIGLISVLGKSPGTLTEWYFIAYVAMLSLWPFDEGPRFIFPVFPLVMLYCWLGINKIMEWKAVHGPRRMLILGAFAALLLTTASLTSLWLSLPARDWQTLMSLVFWLVATLGFAGVAARSYFGAQRQAGTFTGRIAFGSEMRRKFATAAVLLIVGSLSAYGFAKQIAVGRTNLVSDSRHYLHYPTAEAATWLKTHSDTNAPIMAEQWAILYRLSGRKVIAFPVSSNPQLIFSVLRQKHVQFLVVVDPLPFPYFYPTEKERFEILSKACPQAFRLAHQGAHERIFGINISSGIDTCDLTKPL